MEQLDWGPSMNSFELWGLLPEIVEALERSYNLLKGALSDLQKCLRDHEKSKMRDAVLQIRRYVGEIDAVLSRLRAKMQVAEARNDVAGFKVHQVEIARIYGLVTEAGNELMGAMDKYAGYLDGFPKLRDALNVKLEAEHVMEDEPEIYRDLDRFAWWVTFSGEATRKALEMLSKHLETEYERA